MRLTRNRRKPRLLVTAGPTREKIDPVRFISNYSTGSFGYEIAKEAAARGSVVTLVSGPTALKVPSGIRFIGVESALDMKRAVAKEFPKADCVIMAAAVSDWRARYRMAKKMKRGSHKFTLELVENPDILAGLGRRKGKRMLVGFALETEARLAKSAFRKLKEKNLDFIIANRHTTGSAAFGGVKGGILILDRFGNRWKIARHTKRELAKIILDKVLRRKI